MPTTTPQQASAGRSTEAWQISVTILFQFPIAYSQDLLLCLFQEAGPSGALITIESSSSDEPNVPVPETRETLPPVQAREIRFKEVTNLPSESADFLSLLAYPLLYFLTGARYPQQQHLLFCRLLGR